MNTICNSDLASIQFHKIHGNNCKESRKKNDQNKVCNCSFHNCIPNTDIDYMNVVKIDRKVVTTFSLSHCHNQVNGRLTNTILDMNMIFMIQFKSTFTLYLQRGSTQKVKRFFIKFLRWGFVIKAHEPVIQRLSQFAVLQHLFFVYCF